MRQPKLPKSNVIELQPAPAVELEQSPLFDEIDVGSELLTIEEDEANGKYQHTATTLERRRALREDICERIVQGVSERQLARIYKVGRNTLRKLRIRLEQSGKLEPLKRRLAGKLGQVAELSADLCIERLESGDVQSNVLPIMMGVALDKKGQLEAGETEHQEEQAGLNVEALNDWVKKLPSDSQSGEKGVNGQ
jgi:transposase